MKEKKRLVGRPKGIPRAETAGRKKGSGVKNKQLFGYRFTEEEYLNIKENFKDFQKRKNLKPTEAIKKIFLELITIENTEENEKEEK